MTADARRLSVCMIVRNEAAMLARCLDSIDGLYDELCVVDTGSTDNTVALLRSRGARVVIDTSCNDETGRIVDFARARNAVLALARGDWILQIDADEVLVEGAALIRASMSGTHACICVTMESDGARWISGRLFDRRQLHGYRSPIHEYAEHAGTTGKAAGIVIRNLPDKRDKESSRERNIRMLEMALGVSPDEARLWHFLGHEHYRAGQFEQAGDCYGKAVALDNFPAGRYHALYYLGCARLLLGDRIGAESAARHAMDVDARYAEAYCLLGDLLFLRHEFAQARVQYVQALACGGPPDDAVMAAQAWTYDKHPQAQIRRIDALVPRA